MLGSSPLSRGILECWLPSWGVLGIIPALAGNTPYPGKVSPSHHGSSPLSRGIRRQRCLEQCGRGIIPALAGNTPPASSCVWSAGDHPRSRGEYEHAGHQYRRSEGSSPLSRGIPVSRKSLPVPPWIIPALAGNTVSQSARSAVVRDHPRSRGEYLRRVAASAVTSGSSPLSRGIRWLGSTALPVGRDHPRSRGEYHVWRIRSSTDVGSSPLSRGIRHRFQGFVHVSGIIPALAGNTLVDKGFYQPDLSDLGNPLLARLRFSKSLAPRRRRPPSWRGGSSGSASEGPGRTIRVSPS